MTTMLVTSILLVALYVGATTWKRGELPESISSMVYDLPQGRWRWLWTVWLAVVTLLMAPALTAATATAWWTSLLADATIVCLAMTAALPLLPGYHNRLHNALGIAVGVLTQLCVLLISPWWLLVWTLIILAWVWTTKDYPCKVFDGKGVLIAESLCALSLYGALLSTT